MMRIVLAVFLSALTLSIPGGAWAGSLAPTKASQVLTLAHGSAACTSGNSKAVNLLVNADGSTGPFSIPAGQVLVVTGFDWTVYGATASRTAQGAIRIEGPGGDMTLFIDASIADSAGKASKSSPVPNVVVKPGVTLCIAGDGDSIGARLHGFLAKDK